MNIVILDDYQDAVRKLPCAARLDAYPAKVYTNTVKGIGQLSVRLKDADVIVLIRERTHMTRQLIEKLPRLKMIAQTGRAGSHIDLAACTERGVVVSEGVGDPVAPAELTWALIMAAMRRLPHYVANLKHGAWQQSGLKTASMPANFGIGSVLRGKILGIWGYGRIGKLVALYGHAFGMQVRVWGSNASRAQALADVATIGILQERSIRETGIVAEQLQRALDSRVLIEQAKGVLSQIASIDMDESFAMLRNYARTRNLSLRAVAEGVANRSLDIGTTHSAVPKPLV